MWRGIFVVVALLGLAAPAVAQKKVTAKAAVAGVQKYYAANKRMTASFDQQYTNQLRGTPTQSRGKVYLKKPGKMRWDYKAKRAVEKIFMSDGKTAWSIEHNNKQAFRTSVNGTVLPVAVSFLVGNGQLSKNFNAKLAPGKCGSGVGHCLELTPKKASARYTTLWLGVDAKDFHVQESTVLEASGNTNRFEFTGIDTKATIANKLFVASANKLRKNGFKVTLASTQGGSGSGTPAPKKTKPSP
jgi:outer membrane lipoprotein carrier protein